MTCGARVGYQRHRKASESACEACLEAGRQRAKKYYLRRGRELYRSRYVPKRQRS